jgi:hypothetical protein
MGADHFRKPCFRILAAFLLAFPPAFSVSCSSQRPANVRKAEKEKARKDKQAHKQYEKAVKEHMKRQSDATKAMMKQTKKESPKNTPLKPASGKKCK